MKVGVKLQGGAELRRTLESLPHAVTGPHQRQALKAGAEVIRAEAEALAPRGHGEHIADHIVIDALTDAELDRGDLQGAHAAVLIGPEKRFFYGYFLEFGTAKMGPQAFMRPAFDTKVRPAMTVAMSKLWQSILAVTKGNVSTVGSRNL